MRWRRCARTSSGRSARCGTTGPSIRWRGSSSRTTAPTCDGSRRGRSAPSAATGPSSRWSEASRTRTTVSAASRRGPSAPFAMPGPSRAWPGRSATARATCASRRPGRWARSATDAPSPACRKRSGMPTPTSGIRRRGRSGSIRDGRAVDPLVRALKDRREHRAQAGRVGARRHPRRRAVDGLDRRPRRHQDAADVRKQARLGPRRSVPLPRSPLGAALFAADGRRAGDAPGAGPMAIPDC